MKRVLVIGYGNTLRGDDGAGVRAAEHLAAAFPGMECVCSTELQLEMSETISRHDDVFFLDASTTAAGLTCRPLEPSPAMPPVASHALSPELLLSFCRQLYHRLPLRSTLIEIPAFEFDFSETFSALTARMVDECVALVGRMTNGCLLDAEEGTGVRAI